MRTRPPVVSPEPVETKRLGAICCRSLKSWIWAARNCSLESAVMAIGTVCTFSERRSAVTTTVSIWANAAVEKSTSEAPAIAAARSFAVVMSAPQYVCCRWPPLRQTLRTGNIKCNAMLTGRTSAVLQQTN